MKTSVFISHSSKNADFSAWLIGLMQDLGLPKDTIFCSSDPMTGAKNHIQNDIYRALQDSRIDIILLSNEYKDSAYCLNEAGAIRFKEDYSEKIVIVLPGTREKLSAGAFDESFLQYRLSDPSAFWSLLDRLSKAVIARTDYTSQRSARPEEAWVRHKEALDRCIAQLPIVENLTGPWETEQDRKQALQEIRSALDHIRSMPRGAVGSVQDTEGVFYKSFIRSVTISAAPTPGKILVKSVLHYEIVNLSQHDCVKEYGAQFLKNGGDAETYQPFSPKVPDPRVREIRRRHDEGPYTQFIDVEIDLKAHSCICVYMESRYETDWYRFFQSKVTDHPCGTYAVNASFDSSFFKAFGENYIFRVQVMPPVPHNLGVTLVPQKDQFESSNKQSVFYRRDTGFPAGGGYVLTINRVPPENTHSEDTPALEA